MSRPPLPERYFSDDDIHPSYVDVASALPGDDTDALVKGKNGVNFDVSLPSTNEKKRARIQVDYDDSSEGSSPIGPSHVRTISVNDNEDVNGNGRMSPTTSKLRSGRSNSIGSNLSFADKGVRGISLGVGKAVSGVSKGVETVGNMTTSSDDAGSSGGRKRGKR